MAVHNVGAIASDDLAYPWNRCSIVPAQWRSAHRHEMQGRSVGFQFGQCGGIGEPTNSLGGHHKVVFGVDMPHHVRQVTNSAALDCFEHVEDFDAQLAPCPRSYVASRSAHAANFAAARAPKVIASRGRSGDDVRLAKYRYMPRCERTIQRSWTCLMLAPPRCVTSASGVNQTSHPRSWARAVQSGPSQSRKKASS